MRSFFVPYSLIVAWMSVVNFCLWIHVGIEKPKNPIRSYTFMSLRLFLYLDSRIIFMEVK